MLVGIAEKNSQGQCSWESQDEAKQQSAQKSLFKTISTLQFPEIKGYLLRLDSYVQPKLLTEPKIMSVYRVTH